MTYLDVEVDNLKETAGPLGDIVDNLTQCSVVERLRDAARVDSTHGVVGAILSVTLDSTLHGDTTVEDDVDQRGDSKNVRDRSESGVLSKGVTRKGRVLLHEALRTHILERSPLGHDEGDLSELRREKEAIGVAEGVALGANVDIAEERKRLDVAVLVHRVVGHVHVTLANGLTLDTTEVDGLLLRVVLDDLDDGEAVHSSQVSIGGLPDRASGRGVVVQIHTHAGLLGSLASEDVDGVWLGDFCSTSKDLLAAAVHGLHAHDEVAVAHTRVLDLHLELVAGENHADESDIVPE